MNKQAGENSGILTVADTKTLKQIDSVDFGAADGRAVIGFSADKAYATTTLGVWSVDLKRQLSKNLPKGVYLILVYGSQTRKRLVE